MTSTLLYLVEGEAQPDNFDSIPCAMWWPIATLTTVGYGDVYPVTVLGKVLAGLTAITGIGLIAMSAGILAAAFSDAMQRQRVRRDFNDPNLKVAILSWETFWQATIKRQPLQPGYVGRGGYRRHWRWTLGYVLPVFARKQGECKAGAWRSVLATGTRPRGCPGLCVNGISTNPASTDLRTGY